VLKRLLKFHFVVLIALVQSVKAASMMDGFTDPADGMFDVSDWLAEKKGFFPVPMIITEPAVGYGAGRAKDVESENSAETVYSKGMGLRYFIARRFGAHVGFDIARGPKDTAFYLQFGHDWR